jgi:hypothetical protein
MCGVAQASCAAQYTSPAPSPSRRKYWGEENKELVLEVLGPEDGHVDEEQFARDRAHLGVVQNGPHGYLGNANARGVE